MSGLRGGSLLLQSLLGDWRLAQRAAVVLLEPLFNACIVENVLRITRQRDYYFLRFKLNQTNAALSGGSVFRIRLKFSLG